LLAKSREEVRRSGILCVEKFCPNSGVAVASAKSSHTSYHLWILSINPSFPKIQPSTNSEWDKFAIKVYSWLSIQRFTDPRTPSHGPFNAQLCSDHEDNQKPYTKPSKPCYHFEVRGTASFALEDASCAAFSICFDLRFLRYRTNSTNINSTL
jgi:hypothetical protein